MITYKIITLSYSTINGCLQPHNSHNWLNKMYGLKSEDKAIYHEGKLAHDTIQGHVSGKRPHPDLVHIEYTFPIVEEVDFDRRCKFEFPVLHRDNNYNMIGFFDGLDKANGRYLEIKSSSSPWSLQKFQSLIQRKIYALSDPLLKEAICISATRDIEAWKMSPPKVFVVPVTEQDRKDAMKWILEGIKVLESGKYDGGLDENGKCVDRWCYFGVNCQFK